MPGGVYDSLGVGGGLSSKEPESVPTKNWARWSDTWARAEGSEKPLCFADKLSVEDGPELCALRCAPSFSPEETGGDVSGVMADS